MRTFVVTPPADSVVSWAEADAHLRLDGDTSQQTFVESLITAATGHIDGPDGWLGRALGVQTLETRLDNFDCGSIRLPCPPVISVITIRYIDGNGTEQTVASDQYELLGASLEGAFNVSWPSARRQREAVRVRYQAGYADGVPAPIKAAILLMVGDLYSNRETSEVGVLAAVPMTTTVGNLLAPFAVWS